MGTVQRKEEERAFYLFRERLFNREKSVRSVRSVSRVLRGKNSSLNNLVGNYLGCYGHLGGVGMSALGKVVKRGFPPRVVAEVKKVGEQYPGRFGMDGMLNRVLDALAADKEGREEWLKLDGERMERVLCGLALMQWEKERG